MRPATTLPECVHMSRENTPGRQSFIHLVLGLNLSLPVLGKHADIE